MGRSTPESGQITTFRLQTSGGVLSTVVTEGRRYGPCRLSDNNNNNNNNSAYCTLSQTILLPITTKPLPACSPVLVNNYALADWLFIPSRRRRLLLGGLSHLAPLDAYATTFKYVGYKK